MFETDSATVAALLQHDDSVRRLYEKHASLNDRVDQAYQLINLIGDMLAHVNLIPLNPTVGGPYQGSPPERVRAFQAVLERGGVSTTVRLRRGIDIQAGCGQLRARYSAESP